MPQLSFASAVVRHPGEVGERVARLVEPTQRAAGLFLNTPIPLAGRRPPALMLDAARVFLRARPAGDAANAARELLEAVDRALHPLASLPPKDDDFDARWDLGGHAAIVIADEAHVAVARVGEFRALLICDDDVQTLLTEHTLAAALKRDPRHADADLTSVPKNVITSWLGGGGVPSDAVRAVDLRPEDTIVIASSFLLERLAQATLVRCTKNSVRAVAEAIAAAATALDGGSPTGAILVARIDSQSERTARI